MKKVFPASLSSKIVLIFSGMLFFFSLVLGVGSYLFKNTINSVFTNYHEKVLTAFNDYYTSDIQSNRLNVISSLLDEKMDRLSTVLQDFETNVDVLSAVAKQSFERPISKKTEIIESSVFPLRPQFKESLAKNPSFALPISLEFPDFIFNDKALALKYSDLYWQLRPIFRSICKSFDRSLWTYIGFEKDGSVINYPGNFSEPAGYDPRKRPWYVKAHEAKGEVVWTSPYFDTGNKSLVLTVAKASYGTDKRRPIFVAASDVVADRLIRELTNINIDKKLLSVLILNEDNEIVYQSKDEDLLGHWEQLPEYTPANTYFSKIEYESYLEAKNRHFTSFDFRGAKFFLFKRKMPQTKWTIAFLLDRNYTSEFTDKVNGKFNELAKKSILAMRESDFLSNKILALVAISVILFSLCWYFLMKQIIIQPLNHVLGKIRNFSSLSIHDFKSEAGGDREDEIAALNSELHKLKKSQVLYEKTLVQEEASRVRAQITAQVAHDIRSPLSALNMVTRTLMDIEGEKRQLIENATQRINDIANQLLRDSKEARASVSSEVRTDVAKLIVSIVNEKKIQFKHLKNIEFETDFSMSQGLLVNINATELSRVISNLINNAIEALDVSGIVQVSAEALEAQVKIVLKDSGRGIPPDILTKLGQRGVSYGKEGSESGSGLGIHHAIASIESWGGTIEFRSKVSMGTSVEIVLPTVGPNRI